MSCEIAPKRMSLELIDNKSKLAQVMAWCRQEKAITWANAQFYIYVAI